MIRPTRPVGAVGGDVALGIGDRSQVALNIVGQGRHVADIGAGTVDAGDLTEVVIGVSPGAALAARGNGLSETVAVGIVGESRGPPRLGDPGRQPESRVPLGGDRPLLWRPHGFGAARFEVAGQVVLISGSTSLEVGPADDVAVGVIAGRTGLLTAPAGAGLGHTGAAGDAQNGLEPVGPGRAEWSVTTLEPSAW